MKLITFVCAAFLCLPSLAQEKFPDGTPVSDWFKDSKIVDINTLGKKYILTDYGVINDSTLLQTEKIQSAIDAAAQNGGGVIVIPKGTYLSGALFFKPKTHLHLEEGAVLKGSDDISNFPIIDTRMEGQSLKYFTALVNADKVDGFTLSGKGTIDGNGLRYWNSGFVEKSIPNVPIWMNYALGWFISPIAITSNSQEYASSTLPFGLPIFINVIT